MRRGTTPTLTFSIDFSTEDIDSLNIAFAQNGTVIFEKTEDDVTYSETSSEHKIILLLTQEETLELKSGYNCEIQLRVKCGDTVLASNIIQASVESILKDGEI